MQQLVADIMTCSNKVLQNYNARDYNMTSLDRRHAITDQSSDHLHTSQKRTSQARLATLTNIAGSIKTVTTEN